MFYDGKFNVNFDLDSNKDNKKYDDYDKYLNVINDPHYNCNMIKQSYDDDDADDNNDRDYEYKLNYNGNKFD